MLIGYDLDALTTSLESQRVHSPPLAALLVSAVHRAPKPEGANRRDAPSRFSAIDGVDPLGRGGDLRAKIFTGSSDVPIEMVGACL